MLLEQLRDYYLSDENQAPPGYAEAWVRYEIHLDAEGNLHTPEPFDLSDPKRKQGQRRQVPQIVRSSGITPQLLSDNAEYTLGVARQEDDPDKQTRRNERVAQSHAAYLGLLRECADATQAPQLAAVLRFLTNQPLDQLQLPEQFNTGSFINFRVDGQLVTELSDVKHFWSTYAIGDETTDEDKSDDVLQCLICGEVKPALQSLPGNIKGLPGGQSSGVALISANAKAFESYGLVRAQTSPVCFECADGFTKAVNSLIRDDYHSYKLGDLALLYWTRADEEFNLNQLFREPDAASVGELLKAYYSGRPPAPVDEEAFYAVSLSANAARAVVRDWLTTTVGEVKQSLARWFAHQQIVDSYGEPARPLGLYALAAATVRDPRKDLPIATPRALLRSALVGVPLPTRLLYQAIRRNHAEGDVTRPRAALIKLVLISQQVNPQEHDMTQLQPSHPDAGYQCGRLLATLEVTQRAALGRINATIVDRFYGTASSAPASVFARLLRGAQPHLSRLRRERPGTAYALQVQLEDILGNIVDFPRTLTLKEQALFALGYYHQRAHNRAEARAGAERKRAAKDDHADEEGLDPSDVGA